MYELISTFLDNYAHWLSYLAIASIVFLVLSAMFIPKMIAGIPKNYFSSSYQNIENNPSSLGYLLISLLKNIIGIILIICGILMLVLPGQGLLTILAGLLLLKFPGKYKLERYLVSRPKVIKALNWIRRKQNVAELILD